MKFLDQIEMYMEQNTTKENMADFSAAVLIHDLFQYQRRFPSFQLPIWIQQTKKTGLDVTGHRNQSHKMCGRNE